MVDLAAVWCYLSVAASVITENPALCDGAPTALTITNAVVRGLVENGGYAWRGIPSAQSTAGENRRKPPQPFRKEKTPAFFNATGYGYSCSRAYRDDFDFSPQDEDCLDLNIRAPSTGMKLPAFVYFYGGTMAGRSNSNSDPAVPGANFADKSVVYDSPSRRDSAFGFPNFGIQDAAAALDWVHANTQPEHIVLGRHSSGRRAFPSHVPLVGSAEREDAVFSYVSSGIDAPFPSWTPTFDAAMAHIPTAELPDACNASAFASVAATSGQSHGDVRFDVAVQAGRRSRQRSRHPGNGRHARQRGALLLPRWRPRPEEQRPTNRRRRAAESHGGRQRLARRADQEPARRPPTGRRPRPWTGPTACW